jgi:hypothetical protein
MTPSAPRDSAVDAILTAETLRGQFVALLPRLTSPMPADVSMAMGEAQSLYPELWASLDRARSVLRDRGIDVPAYDNARARQPAHMLGVNVKLRDRNPEVMEATYWAAYIAGGAVIGVAASAALDVATSIGAKQGEANRNGLRDARTAIDALQAAMPDVNWKQVRQHEARETAAALAGMERARNKKLLFGALGLGVAIAVGVVLVMVLQASRPLTKEELAAKEQAAFRVAQDEIRDLNHVLARTPCDVKAAERRVSLFVAHNQTRTARRLAKKFIEQCGDNTALRAVADGATASR